MTRKVLNGSNVFVRNPQRIVPDCVSITGDVVKILTRKHQKWATVVGYVARMGGGEEIQASFRYEELGVRIGTPISQISTQPGTPGYSEWARISRSWGYQ